MQKRTYKGASDLQLLQDFNAAAIAVTDHCGYLHPGDIPHHIYSGNRFYDPVELMTIWEDEQGVAAWLLVDVKYKSFDLQVRPDLRGDDFELEILEIATERIIELMKKYEVKSEQIVADAFQGDKARSHLLLQSGWEPDNETPYVLNKTKLNSIEVPSLAEGYTLRTAYGVEEAAALAEVHNAAFGPVWTEEQYKKVMQSPGYDPTCELVIQAPDGTLIAFAVIRFDHLNRTGLFEPVGTHKDYQRQGFGRAVMLSGMLRMVSAGMQYASVAHFGENAAARGLYQSVGFNPWHLIDGYTKPLLS